MFMYIAPERHEGFLTTLIMLHTIRRLLAEASVALSIFTLLCIHHGEVCGVLYFHDSAFERMVLKLRLFPKFDDEIGRAHV